MNHSHQFLQPVEALALQIEANLDPSFLQLIQEADCASHENIESIRPVFRSHCACEQG